MKFEGSLHQFHLPLYNQALLQPIDSHLSKKHRHTAPNLQMSEDIFPKIDNLLSFSIVGHIPLIVNPPRIKPSPYFLIGPPGHNKIPDVPGRHLTLKLREISLYNSGAIAVKQINLLLCPLAIKSSQVMVPDKLIVILPFRITNKFDFIHHIRHR